MNTLPSLDGSGPGIRAVNEEQEGRILPVPCDLNLFRIA